MEENIQRFFEQYQRLFQQALTGRVDMEEVASSYAAAFISASPKGVITGENGEGLKATMEQGFAYYRQIGTKDMRLRQVSVARIDDLHCLARVAWTAIYGRGAEDVSIDFEVHYLIQQIDGAPKIFGWIAGDEQAALKEHGII